ncbi:MAG: glycosyltransferase family 9 protein, partial [Candidatus Aminicenantes bacterium]|nr:glycosyltransferase family 9 protein [Candidatus Aminicenantes bacterium]
MAETYLIVRLSSLGDIIHTIPVAAALRRHRPQARILWLVQRSGRELVDLVSGLDGVIVRGEKGWLRRLRNREQTALDFQGLLKSGLLARLSGARRRLGFSGRNLKEPAASFFYTERLPEFAEEGHVIAKNLRLLSLVGVREEAFAFPLVVPEALLAKADADLRRIGWRDGEALVLCNVGAAWETKRWSSDGWLGLIPALRAAGAFPVLLWGSPDEESLARAVAAGSNVPLAPFLPLGEVLAWLTRARLLVSGDTFALQAACALGVRVVGIFGPTDPRRNGPFDSRDKVVYARVPCAPCYRRTCPTMDCLKA